MHQPCARFTMSAAIVLAAACAPLGGCTNAVHSTATPPDAGPAAAPAATVPADISGTYSLVSINGAPLPYTMTNEPPGVQVTSGTFVFGADGTCGSTIAFVLPSGQASSREVKATWVREGATLTMTWQGAGVTRGTLAGGRFDMDNEGQRFTYEKAK